MKNLPIKFRAKNNFSGEIIYGDLIHHGTKVAVRYQTAPDRYEADIVDPDSVCQLVGYDADGNEVYEGDTVYFKSDENKRPLRAVAGTLLIEIKHTAPEFVVKGGNLHNFIKE